MYMYTLMHTRIRACVHAYMHAYMHGYVRTCRHAYTRVCRYAAAMVAVAVVAVAAERSSTSIISSRFAWLPATPLPWKVRWQRLWVATLDLPWCTFSCCAKRGQPSLPHSLPPSLHCTQCWFGYVGFAVCVPIHLYTPPCTPSCPRMPYALQLAPISSKS